jgi:hypothetical protein
MGPTYKTGKNAKCDTDYGRKKKKNHLLFRMKVLTKIAIDLYEKKIHAYFL